MRKYVPHWEHFVGEPVYQIVVPSRFRGLVLQIPYDKSGRRTIVS